LASTPERPTGGAAIVAAVTDTTELLDQRILELERRLGGGDQPRPWPSGWRGPNEPASDPRIGVVAFRLGSSAPPRVEQTREHEPDPALGPDAGHGTVPGQAPQPEPVLQPEPTLRPERLRQEGVYSRRASERFPAASTMKVYVLQALLEAVVAGDKDLGDTRRLLADDKVTGSGILKLLSDGSRVTLLDLATLMICVSDNSATNMLIDELDIARIRESVEANGWTDTSLSGKLQQAPVVGGTKRSPTMTSPRDLANYFGRLWAGDLLPPELTEVAQRIYRRQQFGELGRSIGYDSYSAEIGVSDVVIASKSGSIRGVRNDAGVIERVGQDGGGNVVIAVMTDGCADLRFHAENLGARVVGEVSAAVLAHLEGPG